MCKKIILNFVVFYILELITSFPFKSLRLLDDEKNVELTFVKIYDMLYNNRTWYFKILVQDDDNLSDGILLSINMRLADINDFMGNTFFVAYCSLKKANHILYCSQSHTYSPSALMKFIPNKYSDFLIFPKKYGNVTWKNGYERDVNSF
jgi:hypothetical protein